MPGGRLTNQDRRQIAAGLADGLTYASICRLQARYRTIYAIIGLVILLNLWGGSHVT